MGGIAKTKRSFANIECPPKSCDRECQYMDMECRCHVIPSQYCRIKNAIPTTPPMPPTLPMRVVGVWDRMQSRGKLGY